MAMARQKTSWKKTWWITTSYKHFEKMRNPIVQYYIKKVNKQEKLIEEENKRHEETLKELNDELFKRKKNLYKVLKRFNLLNSYFDKFKESLFNDL